MANLLVRNVDPALLVRPNPRGVAHHCLLEEEVRMLLRTGLAAARPRLRAENLVTLAVRLFGPEHGGDLDLLSRDGSQRGAPPNVFSA